MRKMHHNQVYKLFVVNALIITHKHDHLANYASSMVAFGIKIIWMAGVVPESIGKCVWNDTFRITRCVDY